MSGTLLLYLAHARDPQRLAIGPALAALAERMGWGFELHYDDRRAGRHFGGGPTERARPGWTAGSLVAGGRHAEQVRALTRRYAVVALGDGGSTLWPALEEAGAETLLRSVEPTELYRAAWERAGEPQPEHVLVVDGRPQGVNGVVTAPFLFPAFLAGEPALGLEASAAGPLGDRAHLGLFVAPDRAPWLGEREGEAGDATYAELTAALAERHAAWGAGILVGDPELVAAQLPRARRRRLVPLYGQPQVNVLGRTAPLVRAAEEPVWGRQYDDRDFLELARLGHGLQVLDPGPPFDVAPGTRLPTGLPDEPDDDTLRAWAEEGRTLATLLFWAGMVRESHCLAPLVDLVAATGLRAGIVLTVPALEAADRATLGLLGVEPARGGVGGLLEPLAGSTGYGVAAEALLPRGMLAGSLRRARAEGLAVRGWWPLIDTALVPHEARRVERRGLRPVIRFTPRDLARAETAAEPVSGRTRDVRALAGEAVRRLRLESLFEERRPFDDRRPGPLDRGVADAVRDAGFEYMWTKARFGESRAELRDSDFVALPFTAGNWDGWSPFYTVGSVADVERAERRLLKASGPGWLASTIDSPLFLLPGELLEHGSRLYELAALVAAGGRSGRLVNVTPNVIARYSRLL